MPPAQKPPRQQYTGAMRFSGELDWIYTRVLEKSKSSPVESPWGFDMTSLNAMKFRDFVEFDLMHEFVEGYFFDFHVDTKPNDGTHPHPHTRFRSLYLAFLLPPNPYRKRLFYLLMSFFFCMYLMIY